MVSATEHFGIIFVQKKIKMKQLCSSSLLALSLSLKELMFFPCFKISCWATFLTDMGLVADALERVSDKLKQKAYANQQI